MRAGRLRAALPILLLAALASASAAVPPWELPAPDACAPAGGLRGLAERVEAGAPPFASGQGFGLAQLELLRDFLPAMLWAHRERFFYEGMRLEIGACFADYGPPEFYREATRKFAGQARLTGIGGLEGYTAGLPFPAAAIDAEADDAGQKWAWNVAQRYHGAGLWTEFRTSDIVASGARAEPFIGEIFKAHLLHRADRAEAGYRAPGSKSKHWVAGGQMFAPFDARHYSWRQYRDAAHLNDPDRTDDVHAYIPELRRVRRLSGSGVEGLYMPSFSVGVLKPGQLMIGGAGGSAGGGVASAASADSITTKRSGFEGLEIRPLLYRFRVLGVHDVLTPLNARTPSYPEQKERDFGSWGLSFASDRWDLRRAVVLEGQTRRETGGDQVARQVLYLDAQTQQPLYYVSWDARDEVIDVGMFVGRWSEERDDYRPWPDDPKRPVRVIDSVGAAFAHIDDGGGWRRESWTLVSTPPSDRQLKRDLSVNDLTKRR